MLLSYNIKDGLVIINSIGGNEMKRNQQITLLVSIILGIVVIATTAIVAIHRITQRRKDDEDFRNYIEYSIQ